MHARVIHSALHAGLNAVLHPVLNPVLNSAAYFFFAFAALAGFAAALATRKSTASR
jgi:hypothetical protein